ncbi:non-ribosomal peptide synthetase [Lasiosphaeria miniovina]|uniref:Non-ribosomal peptide synthetase n=1 Tax=Lasiosphaeria miniovina TaxID=1954250 RepID=A0AA40AB05_9PEZI|nr:non-ribosomal peptide synthetase [Lasiosphaeria miniovina]KAK0712561.1 non-ribosomal peptide synthetase [Lasiosphaeria miniovina]
MDAAPRFAAPRIDASTSWLLLEDESIDSRFLVAMAQVLDVDQGKIRVQESFRELGGDEKSAAVLRKACMDIGIDVKIRDILRCSTIAELQTCISPCARQSQYAETLEPVMIAPLEIHKASRLSARSEAKGSHSRNSSQSSSGSQIVQRTGIEQALGTQTAVDRIATVRPKAGLLEGKLVALLTLSGALPSAEDSPPAINLIPQSQSLFAGTQVAVLKQTAEAALPSEAVPDIWIVLDVMPLTESGEVDIRRLRTWAQNINEDIYQQATGLGSHETLELPQTAMEKSLQILVSKVLDAPPGQIGVNFTFCQLGGDEMTAIELVARCKHESIYLSAAEVLGSTTLSELAVLAASRGAMSQKWDEETLDSFDLSPMQHLYFKTAMGGDLDLRTGGEGSYRFNQSLLLRFKKSFTFESITAAIEAVVGHHPMLRSRFSRGMAGWSQRILPEVAGSYSLCHSAIRSDRELEDILEKTQYSIDIESGPVFAVDYLTTHDGQQMVYLAAHHLAVDLPSWRIVIHDLDEMLENGNLLSQRSMPFHNWVDVQKADAQGREPQDLLPFPVQPGDYAYWGLQGAPNTYGDALEVSFSLSHELTSILQTSCNLVFRTDCVDIYLAALMLSFAQTFHDRSVPVVWNQEHGREPWNTDIDISETVGWFTSLCPINQKVDTSDDLIAVLRRLKDIRRSIPTRGAQYFASRFYDYEKADLSHDWPFEIIFSYAGSLQHLERDNGVMEQFPIPGRTLASPTSDIGPNVGRIALFEVSAMIDQGAAKVKFLYSRFSKDQSRISQWIQNYEHLLLEAIGRLRYHQHEITLSDVPHLDVTYESLAKFHRKERLAALNLTCVRELETIYPVTAVQQSILISQAQRPDACYLHAIYEFAAPNGGSIDHSKICTAWEQVTMRHAALRTVFTESISETGLWDKIILHRTSPEMLFIDTAPSEDPVYELSNLVKLRPTDKKPLHRLTVCKAPSRTFVKLDISTALCDSISIHILLHDLRRAYATERALSDPAQFSYPSYLDFLKGVRQESSLGYWRERLAKVSPCLFPRLSMAPEEHKFTNANLDLEIAATELAAFTRSHKITVGAVLRLAWGLVLRCFAGSNTVCFGYQTLGRDDSVEGMRHAVGSFANTVPCNYELSSYTPLNLALQLVEDQMATSLPHQHFTMAELQHAMGMRGGDRLFNSCLTFTEEPAGLNSKFTTRSSFELKPVSLQQTFDADVVVNTRFSGGNLVVDMGQRVMAPEQSLNVANTFGRAIRAVLTMHNTSIGLVDLCSDRDYAQILAWDSQTPAAAESQAQNLIHELISNQASLQPTAQAICSWDGNLSYEQLEEEATKLAHHLVDAGVGPHSVVPVVMEKSRLSPVAMLAVLKSGAAFVPIDALELSMIQPIFERLNSRVAIASEHAAPVLGNLFEKVVTLTDELMNGLPRSQGSLTSMAAPADPACILFVPTSSSEARGMSFSHAALSTALSGQGPAARITSLSRVMQLSSFNVDICITEIFTTLVCGGCVCIPLPTEKLHDFAAAVNRMQVNWTYMTPLLSRKLEPSNLPSLKVVCFRTRSLDDDTYAPWHGKVNVILAYGPQDVCPLGISFLEALGTYHLRSIGRPFSGNLLIVNPEDHKKRVPTGAVGELVVEGPTLGCAYPNRESTMLPMTPLAATPGRKARYFKTGHRARYTEGGLMEFISSKREDTEIDGKLVNTTEIEQYLRRCLGQGVDVIVDAMTFRGTKADAVLAAFIELGDSLFDGEENLASLSPATKEQAAMAKQLVEVGLKNAVAPSMIPSIFIPVKHLPITPSLKVNRRRLQKMINGMSKEQLLSLSAVPNTNEAKFNALKPLPLTHNEERMRAVWARVLGVEEAKIGALDPFFGAGGDEILAAQLIAACRQDGITVSIADVLRNASLTELCRAMMTIESPQVVQDSSPIPVTPPPVPPNNNAVTFIEKVIAPKIGVDGSVIKDVAEASSVQIRYIETGMLRGRANINYLVFNFSGAVDAKKLEDACVNLVAIHPILRTVFVPYNRRVYQAVLASPDIEFRRDTCPSWRLTGVMDKTIRKDQLSPVAFCSPMTKFMFLDGTKQSILVMRLTKAQYDDLSIALLVKDLKRLYDGSQNPPRRPTYCDFIRSSQMVNAQGAEEHWRALLDGAAMTQVVAHTHPYQLSTNIKTIRHSMNIGSLSSLGISFETVLKGAWAMVLAALSASPDVVFGELIDGRHVRLLGGHPVAGVMGPTVNAIPVRVQFPQEHALTPLALLQHVHAQRISGIPYENLGTLSIVEKCTPWPYWTRFSTLVQHQYEDTAVNPNEPKPFHLGAASCKFTVVESKAQDVPDLFVRSIVRGAGRVELSITFCADRIPEPFAEHALRNLHTTVSLLTSVSIMQQIIPNGFQYRTMQKRIPIALNAALASPGMISGEEAVNFLSADQAKAIQSLISQTWTPILNPRTLGVPEAQVHNAAFFDLWGSLIPAAQLTAQLNRELPRINLAGIDGGSLKLTMEEIVDNPTMLKQFELIASKIKAQTTQAAKGKEREKEGEREKADARAQAQMHRRKPSINVSVSPAAIGSRIRRFASTVGRSDGPGSRRTGLAPMSSIPSTTPVAIGIASAMVAEMVNPLSPKIITANISAGMSASLNTIAANSNRAGVPNSSNNGIDFGVRSNASPIPREPPQLPHLPAFKGIAEEESDMLSVVALMVRETSSRGATSSADSLTDGSSACSNHSGDDETDPVAPLPGSPVIREEEDLVSPMTAVSPKNNGTRFFDKNGSDSPKKSLKKERNSVFSKTGMSPIVG